MFLDVEAFIFDFPTQSSGLSHIQHLEIIRAAHKTNPMINVRLAQAILAALEKTVAGWQSLPPHSHPWLKAAMHYFAVLEDDEPDLTSPIGFEDDAEILNACLRLAGKEEWSINPAEYDDV